MRAAEVLGTLLAELVDHARLVRGKELADRGRVHDLDIQPGRVTGSVTGSRSQPYEVVVRLPESGGPPQSAQEMRFDCTCPDWADPCKHAVAVTLALAERLDAEPDLAVQWWGRAMDPARVGGGTRRTPVELPGVADRPAWAEDLAPREPTGSIEAWLGGMTPSRRPTLPNIDGVAEVLELGRLDAAEGIDIAPALQLLLIGLTSDHD
ncbi:MAG: hypothetical protein JWL70_2734 [Acidimicrobiia bacterium]|nr:hypothetical protein [Acidimicrobiia bacterium]